MSTNKTEFTYFDGGVLSCTHHDHSLEVPSNSRLMKETQMIKVSLTPNKD